MLSPKTIEELKSDFNDNKYIILEEETELFTNENIDSTIKILEDILKKYPNLEIRIVRNIGRKDNSYENLTFIKNKLLKNENTQKEKRILIQTPGTVSFKNYEVDFNEEEFNVKETFYSMKEIYESEKIFNLISSSIEKDNFTNFEKILACYMIVVQFKNYKEVTDIKDNSKSRSIYSILKNDYIVCEGYTRFLNYILGKLNIQSSEMIYSRGTKGAHAVSIVNIDDDKYSIHGKFVFDPTVENYLMRKNNFDEFACPIAYFAHSIDEFESSHRNYIDDLIFVNTHEELLPSVNSEEDLYETVSEDGIPLDKIKLCIQRIYTKIFQNNNLINETKYNEIINKLLDQRKEITKGASLK